MSIYSTRDLTLSVEYRIYQALAKSGWLVAESRLPLVAVAGTDIPAYSYNVAQVVYPWCFFDINFKNTSRDHVQVYLNNVVVDPATYDVNFRAGRVTFHNAVSGTLTADVTYFAAGVREGYPREEELLVTNLPLVAYNVDGQYAAPFAVGSAADLMTYPLDIDLLCTDDGQRKDMSDDLLVSLKAVPLLAMAQCPFLTDSGDANPAFSFDTQFVRWANVFNRNSRLLHPRAGGLDKERYRALLTASLKNVT